jgi:hypothetical protein
MTLWRDNRAVILAYYSWLLLLGRGTQLELEGFPVPSAPISILAVLTPHTIFFLLLPQFKAIDRPSTPKSPSIFLHHGSIHRPHLQILQRDLSRTIRCPCRNQPPRQVKRFRRAVSPHPYYSTYPANLISPAQACGSNSAPSSTTSPMILQPVQSSCPVRVRKVSPQV